MITVCTPPHCFSLALETLRIRAQSSQFTDYLVQERKTHSALKAGCILFKLQVLDVTDTSAISRQNMLVVSSGS